MVYAIHIPVLVIFKIFKLAKKQLMLNELEIHVRSSSNRSWAYTGEKFYAPSASKICLRRSPTTTCKGNDYGLKYKLNIYTKI